MTDQKRISTGYLFGPSVSHASGYRLVSVPRPSFSSSYLWEGLSERQKREVGAAPLGNQSEFLDGLSVYIGIMWLVFKPILMLAAIALAARAWQSSARVPVLMIWALLLYNAAVVSVFAEAQARYVHLGIALMLLAAFASYAAGRCRSSS